MSAKIIETSNEDGWLVEEIVAAPAGEYGFGTIGQAQPRPVIESEAWRMVQRAGLATRANRDSARFINNGPSLVVVYGMR